MYNRLNNKSFIDETSPDESQMETSDFPLTSFLGQYDSTSMQDKSAPQFYVPWCGLIFYVMAFFGFFCAFLVRTCLSIAIVAMVNQTAVAQDTAMTNVSEDRCLQEPELNQNRAEGKQFNWDRNQQGMVLSAFYFGYIVTQVLYIVYISRAYIRKGHLG